MNTVIIMNQINLFPKNQSMKQKKINCAMKLSEMEQLISLAGFIDG